MSGATKAEKNTALLVASLASFLTPFMGSSIIIALPSIGADLSTDAISLSWIATSYLLAAAVFLIPLGRAADILGRKKIFVWGITGFTVASLLCGTADSVLMLIVYRVFQAVGSAMIFGTGIAIITSVFPFQERGRAMGISVAAVYIGLTLGPSAGGLMTQHLGWRSLFFLMVPLGLFIIFFSMKKLKGEWAEARGEKFDWRGSLLYGVSLVLIMYGFPKLPDFGGMVYLGGGLICLLFFILSQLKTRFPLLDLKLFNHNITFRYSNLAALINYMATSAVAFLLSFYLQYIKNMSPQETGLLLVVQPFMMAILSPSAGKLADRTEPRLVASAGMALSMLGLLFLIFISPGTGIPGLVLNLMLLGVGFALFSSPNTHAIMSSVERKYLGVASGTVGTMRLIGQMLSMGIAMMLIALFVGQVEIGPDNLEGLIKAVKWAFGVFTLLCFGGIFASLARGKIR